MFTLQKWEEYKAFVLSFCKDGSLPIGNILKGIVGEMGELVDWFKKSEYPVTEFPAVGKLQTPRLAKANGDLEEMGGLLFYLCCYAHHHGLGVDDLIQEGINECPPPLEECLMTLVSNAALLYCSEECNPKDAFRTMMQGLSDLATNSGVTLYGVMGYNRAQLESRFGLQGRSWQMIARGQKFELKIVPDSSSFRFDPEWGAFLGNQGLLYPISHCLNVIIKTADYPCPVDILFVHGGKIVALFHEAEPSPGQQRYVCAAPVSYVVQLKGGKCAENGIALGDEVSILTMMS